MKMLALFALCLALNAHADSNGSCTFADEGSCVQYDGAGYTQVRAQIQAACQEESGSYSADGCSAQGKLGTCHMDEEAPTYYSISFYAPMTSDDAKASCSIMAGRFE